MFWIKSVDSTNQTQDLFLQSFTLTDLDPDWQYEIAVTPTAVASVGRRHEEGDTVRSVFLTENCGAFCQGSLIYTNTPLTHMKPYYRNKPISSCVYRIDRNSERSEYHHC